jgi:ATP-dependent DNA helicase RecG
VRALVLEDLGRYPESGMSEIRSRVGEEIPERSLRRALEELGKEGLATWVGERRWRRYSPTASIGQTDRRGR